MKLELRDTDDAERDIVWVYNALRDPQYVNFCLLPCQVNGEKSMAICVTQKQGDKVEVEPVFVFVTPKMKLVDPQGRETEEVA